MSTPNIPLIDWQRLRNRNPFSVVWDAVIIGVVLCIGAIIIGVLRLYCLLRRDGHDWEDFPGDDFTPAMDSECRCCGATKPFVGPRFHLEDER